MKRKEIIRYIEGKSADDLQKELGQNRDKLWQLKVDLAAGKVKNVSEIKRIKATIARILTKLSITS